MSVFGIDISKLCNEISGWDRHYKGTLARSVFTIDNSRRLRRENSICGGQFLPFRLFSGVLITRYQDTTRFILKHVPYNYFYYIFKRRNMENNWHLPCYIKWISTWEWTYGSRSFKITIWFQGYELMIAAIFDNVELWVTNFDLPVLVQYCNRRGGGGWQVCWLAYWLLGY